MELRISDIIEEKRIRQNLGDLSELMKSMRQFGLMNPILVDENNNLIAGGRRLEAARRMGWTSIEVKVIPRPDSAEALEMEIDENIHRKNLTPDELADAWERLKKLKNPGLFRRLWNAVRDLFKRIFKRTES